MFIRLTDGKGRENISGDYSLLTEYTRCRLKKTEAPDGTSEILLRGLSV
jgi:hypothetical protein